LRGVSLVRPFGSGGEVENDGWVAGAPRDRKADENWSFSGGGAFITLLLEKAFGGMYGEAAGPTSRKFRAGLPHQLGRAIFARRLFAWISAKETLRFKPTSQAGRPARLGSKQYAWQNQGRIGLPKNLAWAAPGYRRKDCDTRALSVHLARRVPGNLTEAHDPRLVLWLVGVTPRI